MMNGGHLLVTGFGPFPGMAANPSATIARRIGASARLRRLPGGVRAVVLRTAYAAIETELAPLLAERPAAVLMIGVAGRARRVRVEWRAMNRASRLMPDVGGSPARRLALDADGPAARRAGTLAKRAEIILRRAGIEARLSRDAGRYLCNASYYRALAEPCPVLFLHIPRPPRATPGIRRRTRQGWHEALAAAFAEVAALMAGPEARRQGRRGQGRSAT